VQQAFCLKSKNIFSFEADVVTMRTSVAGRMFWAMAKWQAPGQKGRMVAKTAEHLFQHFELQIQRHHAVQHPSNLFVNAVVNWF